jgi:fructose-1,6-bisphosphatase/inositol monophosphatase family enzyme
MPLNSPRHDFLRLLEPAVREASKLARRLEGRVANQPKPHENSAVKQALTEADTRVQEVLLLSLADHFPDVALAAEEDTASVSRFPKHAPSQVVIDPIDGTLNSYLEARGPYALMMGLVVRNRYEAAFVALPREGLLFAAARGEGGFAARAGGPLRPVRAELRGNRVLVAHAVPQPARSWLESQGYEVIPACGGALSIAPLVVGCRAGLRWSPDGSIGISVRGRIGALIAAEAGCFVRAENGRDFPLDQTTRAATLRVTAREEDLNVLDEALRAAGCA